jgi:hypothetical protein
VTVMVRIGTELVFEYFLVGLCYQEQRIAVVLVMLLLI